MKDRQTIVVRRAGIIEHLFLAVGAYAVVDAILTVVKDKQDENKEVKESAEK